MAERDRKIDNRVFIGGDVSGVFNNNVGTGAAREAGPGTGGEPAARVAGAQIRAITRALAAAFPTPDALRQLVRFHLDQDLGHIARGTTHWDDVFHLVEWAEAHGKLEALLSGAREENPESPELRALRLDGPAGPGGG